MRKKYNFWLDEKNQKDWVINDLITKLKSPGRGQGMFTRAIREGLRLWDSLREGSVDVLLELFPWVEEEICKRQPPDTEQLQREIKQLQMLILQQGNIPAPPKDYPSMKPIIPLPAAPKVEVKAAAMLSADSLADNFLSMASMFD